MKVFIFVKNKLNSTDTVIPLLLELNNKFSITSKEDEAGPSVAKILAFLLRFI